MASLHLSRVLFCKHLIWGDPLKGQAVECCSYLAAQHRMRQRERWAGDPQLGYMLASSYTQSRGSCYICCTEKLQDFSLHWSLCGPTTILLSLISWCLSSCYNPCPSNVPCRCALSALEMGTERLGKCNQHVGRDLTPWRAWCGCEVSKGQTIPRWSSEGHVSDHLFPKHYPLHF